MFDGLEFRVLRDRLFENLESEEEATSPASTSRRPARAGRGRSVADGHVGEISTGRSGPAGSACRWRAPGARGTGEVTGLALANGDRSRRLARPGRARRRRTTPPWPRGWPTPSGPRCSTTPRGRCWRWPRGAGRWTGSSATPRSRRTSPGPTSAPTTWPTWPCATSSASCKTGPVDDGDQLSLDGIGDDAAGETAMLQARAVLDLAEALDDELDDRGGTGAAGRRRAAAGRRAGRHGADRHRRRHRLPRVPGGAVRRRGARRRRRTPTP